MLTELGLVRAAHIILASASPRRSSILNDQLQCHVRVVPSTFMEDLDKAAFTPQEYVKENARQKALESYARVEKPFRSAHQRGPSLVIGADTVVVLDGKILEKPASTEHARTMLRELSRAGTHTVCTGVSLVYGDGVTTSVAHEHTFCEETSVQFRELEEAEIEAYVATGEPMDKAGSYGIQGLGGAFVTGIVGDYHNVVGFPVARFCQELDTSRLSSWIDAAPREVPQPPAGAGDLDADSTADFLIDEEACTDLDECGLPSD